MERRVASGMSSRGVTAEEDDLANPVRPGAGKLSRREPGARAGEHRRRLTAAGVEHSRQLARLGLSCWRTGELAIGESCTDPVVAHDAVCATELLVEAPDARVVPLLLQMGHPSTAEEEQRPFAHRRVRDPPSVELAEADVLLHDPAV